MRHLLPCVAAAAALVVCAAPARAQTAVTVHIDGSVVDAQTGLALGTATVSIVDRTETARTDAAGRFALVVPPGVYRLRIARDGYQPSISDDVVAAAGQSAVVTLSVQRAETGDRLTTIGRSSVQASGTLQRAGTITRTLNAETLADAGVNRAADALRLLPGINNGIGGDTGALGDDVQLSIRGIGQIETSTSLDGHPIAYGIKGGYNFQLSPIAAIRNINVTYGSGSDLFPVSAIGGVVDFQTIDPTPNRQFAIRQGFGTFSQTTTNLQATGTQGKLGYAFAYGVTGLDGPFHHDTFVQAPAAYDQSATDPAVRALGAYDDDSSTTAREGMVKLRYDLSSATTATFTGLASSYYENKTGNGDGDYLTYNGALNTGTTLLAKKAKTDPCPAGTFTATNANGVPNGTGPNGQPDGGIRCQTPQQYAGFNMGFQGAGGADQKFAFDDGHLNLTTTGGANVARFDAYSNRYGDVTQRYGNAIVPTNTNTDVQVVDTGAIVSDSYTLGNHTLGAGYSHQNLAYVSESKAILTGAPIVQEDGYFIRDAYHAHASPFTAYFDSWFRRSTTTNVATVDPRLSLVYTATPRDVVRVAAGANTTQPTADYLGKNFVGSLPGGPGGGASISCSGLNSIGPAPSSILKPERGVDQELAYGHSFGGDSQVQATFYNTNVYNKLYSTVVPIAQTGTGFIDPAFLASAEAKITSVCGATTNPLPLLGLTGNVNVGQLRAQGFTIQGRQHLTPRAFIDYDYATTNVVLVSAPTTLLQSNKTLVLGSQLPHVPPHTFDGAFDVLAMRNLDIRYDVHAVSNNNTKSLPAYNFSSLRVSTAIAQGTFSATVQNLFNQYADIRGIIGEGVPVMLNQYATAADYAPYTGTAYSKYEKLGLPYRSVYFTYALRFH
jgi:outer membrane receptor protein involved in Fe transport